MHKEVGTYNFGEGTQRCDLNERVLIREKGHHIGHESLKPALVVHVRNQLDKDVERQQARVLRSATKRHGWSTCEVVLGA
jgi:hypothetical protein